MVVTITSCGDEAGLSSIGRLFGVSVLLVFVEKVCFGRCWRSRAVQLRFRCGSDAVQLRFSSVQLRFSFGEIARRRKIFSPEKN